MGLDVGLRDGLSAPQMASTLKAYLKAPDKLFRRVRDAHGILHLSKRAKAYHPGRGVYRSSFKNARRLAATECNIAYRTADHLRWQGLDFVVGIKVQLSNNHTCLGKDGKPHPFHDICDDLVGLYPKDFKFVGWHPHCRCFATSVLKTDAERRADNRRIMQGEEPLPNSVNEVTKVPKVFGEWVEKNKERIAASEDKGTLPYFLRDNKQWYKPEEKIAPNPKAEPARKKLDAGEAKFGDIIKMLEEEEVEYKGVRKLKRELSESEIISRLAGGDLTGGSCSSLAFAYAGNKGGLDVLDFRGGKSQDFFSRALYIRKIAESVGGVIVRESNDFKAVASLLELTTEGKEYYLSCGSHVAIVRKVESRHEFLELQSATSNGFEPLNNAILKNRFRAKKSRTHYGQKWEVSSVLIDLDLLNDSGDFKKMLGYINTNKEDQKKGEKGKKK